MNKEYINVNGQVVAYDDKIGLKTSLYTEEGLVVENIIETIVKKLINDNELLIDVNKKIKNYPYAKKTDLIFILVGVLTLVASGLLFSFVSEFIIKMIIMGLFSFIPGIGLIPSIGDAIFNYHGYKKAINFKNGLEREIEFLKRKLGEQQEILHTFKNEEELDISPKKVDDTKSLEDLDIMSDYHYASGFNEARYLKYYQTGQLEKHLAHKLSPSQYDELEQHLKSLDNNETGAHVIKRVGH